jgi:hypothetical protein
MRRFIPLPLALALACSAAALPAQSILDFGARVAPQFVQYKIQSPTNTTVSEFASPLFVVVPMGSRLTVDVGSAFAWSRVEQTSGGKTTTSTISGPTDTQIRANYTMGTDFVVLTAGVNLPTGQSTVTADQVNAASLIGSNFLLFPIPSMGTGFGATGGVAVAQPLGEWNFGGGMSVRKSNEYSPFTAQGGQALHYQPGDEYRVRLGLDRGVGTGRLTFGFTYSRFGDDNLSGSIYNTGDRYLGQVTYSNTIGVGDLAIVGWNLFRNAGTLADSSKLGTEDVGSVTVSYGWRSGSVRLEPMIEGRTWTQNTQCSATSCSSLPMSGFANVGLRLQFDLLGLGFAPSAGYTIGRVAAASTAGNTTADLTGYRAVLLVRLR